MAWTRTDERMPPAYHVVQTQHEDDLYPVSAYWMMDDGIGVWLRETEGPEDGFYGGGRHEKLYRAPTHWQELPESPLVEAERLHLERVG